MSETVKNVLRPVKRVLKRAINGNIERPPTDPISVFDRWRESTSQLLDRERFLSSGLYDVWERYPGKYDRQAILMQCYRDVFRRKVGGAVVELGCYQGHTAIQLAHAMREHGDRSEFILFDSFAGMPQSSAPEDTYWQKGSLAADYDIVFSRFSSFENVKLVRGYFADTLPDHNDVRVKLAHVDSDMYTSVKEGNEWLLRVLARGGVIVFDDYGFESCVGAKKAVDEDFAMREDFFGVSLPTGQYLAIRTR